MKKSRKVIALLSAVAIMGSVSGCGKKNEVSTNTGNVVFGQDDLKFSFYYHEDGATAKDWPSNEADQWLIDNKKVYIETIDAGGASSEKLATMIVSNEFPDLIQVLQGQDSEKLIKSGVAVPINEYLDKYPNIKTKLEEKGVLSLLTRDDGKIYEIPNWFNVSDHMGGNNCWILNKNIYESLGSPEIKTFDDLYDYLKAVKEKYPDVIPYETTSTFAGEKYVLCGMAEDLPPEHLEYYTYNDNGTLKSIFEHPEYENTWLFLNKLFRERLITQDAFSQTNDQFLEKLSTGRVAVVTTEVSNAEKARAELTKTGNDYISITPVMKAGLNRDKVYISGANTLGWTEFLITRDAENPEAIFAFLDWLFTPEGQALELFGVPGKYYDGFNEDGYPQPTEAYNNLESTSAIETLSFSIGTSWWDDASFYMNSQGMPESAWPWGGKQQRKNIWPYVKDITEYNGIVPNSSTDAGLVYQNIKELHNDIKAKMLFASSEDEVKQLITQLREQSKQLGMDTLVAEETKVWEANKAKLEKK